MVSDHSNYMRMLAEILSQRRLTTVVCMVRPKQAGTRTHWWVQNCRDQAACPLSLLAGGRLTKVEQGHCPDDVRYASRARKQIAQGPPSKIDTSSGTSSSGATSTLETAGVQRAAARSPEVGSSRQVLALL